MSDDRYREKLIKDFLDEVEEKLPFWLKTDEDELKEVLAELREHVEDKVEAIEETGKSKLEATQLAISQMGSPTTIAREYKRRGTPKLYITEELWPTYLTVLKYAGLGLGLLFLIYTTIKALLTGLSGGNWLGVFANGMKGLFFTSLMVASGISVLFVWLSYEGFFLEDLKMIFKSKEARKAEKERQKMESLGPPKVTIEKPIVEKPKKILPKGVEKSQDLVGGGIFTLVIGFIAVWQPFAELNALIHPQFLVLGTIMGIAWVIIGILGIIHGMFSNWSYIGNKIMIPLRAIVVLGFAFPIIVFLFQNPQIFPIIWWSKTTGLTVVELGTNFYWIYYLILFFVLLGTIIGKLKKIYYGARLEEEDFFFIGDA